MAAVLVSCASNTAGTQINQNLLTFATQAKAYVDNFNANVAQVAQGAAQVTLVTGKDACGAASMLNGVFNDTLTQSLMAANKVDPTVTTQEQATYAAVQGECAIIDAANPANPTAANVVTAAAGAVKSVEAIQAALKTGAPQVATATGS